MRSVRPMALALLVSLSASYAARADNDVAGPDWMPKEEVMKKLESAGYSNIPGIHADVGHWEGKGAKNGQITEFHVDPKSGALTKEEVDND